MFVKTKKTWIKKKQNTQQATRSHTQIYYTTNNIFSFRGKYNIIMKQYNICCVPDVHHKLTAYKYNKRFAVQCVSTATSLFSDCTRVLHP